MSAPISLETPVLLALPQGMTVTGVTTWALRLAGALVELGRPAGLIVHGGLAEHREFPCDLPPGVRLFRADDLPEIGSTRGDLSPFLPLYRDAITSMSREHGRPCVLVPTRHGDCFGISAHLSREIPDAMRVIGWQHLDSAYENAVIDRYEPLFAKMAGVSSHIACLLRRRFPRRAHDTIAIANGVLAPDAPPQREPLTGRPIRLIYTGRLEHEQKRVMALVALSDELRRRGVAHRLTIVGDGPALERLQEAGASRDAVEIVAGVRPDRITPLLDRSDVFVLASRREGMSVSLLEAMARGCAPAITKTASGAEEVIASGRSGELVDFDDTMIDPEVGLALADAVQRLIAAGVEQVGQTAWERVHDGFSIRAQGERAARLIESAANAPARSWPDDLDPAFTSPGVGSGAVPPDAGDRITRVLANLEGRRVLIHGAGAHTLALVERLSGAPANIVGVTDDDPERAGGELAGLPIIEPKDAAATGATDVVISSWLHEEAVWSRRDVFEAQGLRVHRLYAD